MAAAAASLHQDARSWNEALVETANKAEAMSDLDAEGNNDDESRVPNRQLSHTEREQLFAPLLAEVRHRLHDLAGDDDALHWALRRKLFKELVYDERSKPMQRKALKAKKRKEQSGLCGVCQSPLPERDTVLDRRQAMNGYTAENTRLICRSCDTSIQSRRGYA
jgi:hypothetical protein